MAFRRCLSTTAPPLLTRLTMISECYHRYRRRRRPEHDHSDEAFLGRLDVGELGGPAVTDEGGYDYIIIGAGTAGCMLANRLTKMGNPACCFWRLGDRTAITGCR